MGILPPEKPLPMFCQPEDPNVATGFCKDGTPGALGYAFINMAEDPDGFIRDGLLFGGGATPVVSFPVMLAQQYTGQIIKPVNKTHASFNGHDVYYDVDNASLQTDITSFRIGSWGYSPVTHIPAWKFLAGQVPPNAVTDKLVLIGQSNDAARDREYTPLFREADKNGPALENGRD